MSCHYSHYTVKYGLQSYASILYYRYPPGFRIILRGQDVRHHDLAEDLMYTQELSYKPQGFESSRDVKVDLLQFKQVSATVFDLNFNLTFLVTCAS